jgi:hypothetical protein
VPFSSLFVSFSDLLRLSLTSPSKSSWLDVLDVFLESSGIDCSSSINNSSWMDCTSFVGGFLSFTEGSVENKLFSDKNTISRK